VIIKKVKTRVFLPPKDDLFSLIKESLTNLKENSVIVFTSKIVSIWEGRCIRKSLVKNREELIKKEAKFYIKENNSFLTIKHNSILPSAGIDESNGDEYYILLPKHPFLSAKKIYYFIKTTYKLKKFGIIISDSHTIPLRKGTIGISLAYWGIKPLRDYRGKKDIFGRKLKVTQLNIVDSLAAIANLAMGEGKERTPIVIIENLKEVEFEEKAGKINYLKINRERDIYKPLLSVFKNGKSKHKEK